MNKTSGIVAIFREFLTRYPWQFGLLFLFLVIEGVSAAISVMALVPLADFMLDPSLAKPGLITQLVINALSDIGFSPTFWIFGSLFVASSFLKGLLEVGTRYAILRIKYAVVRGLFGDALHTFLKPGGSFLAAQTKAGCLIR